MTDPFLDDIESQLYAKLRRIAGAIHDRARPDLARRTSLIHEAWLRLASSPALQVQSRAHLLALSARAMRHLLVVALDLDVRTADP